jgi:hypothetical protein
VATRAVTAEEIRLFRLLTWLRHPRLPGRRLPETILTPPPAKPIVDVALAGGFVLLAEEAERELALGAVVVHPRRPPRGVEPTAEVFRDLAAPGYAKAAEKGAALPGIRQGGRDGDTRAR